MDPDFNPNIAPPKDAKGSPLSDDSSIPSVALPGQAAKHPSVSQPGAEPALTATEGDQAGSDGKGAADPYGGGKAGLGLLANKKLLAIVGGSVLLLLIVIVVVAASGGGKTPTARRTPVNTVTQNPLPEVVNRPDGTLDLSRRVDTSAVIHGQKIQASATQQVNLSSGLSHIVEAIGTYSSASALPSAGKKYIIILMTVGNHALSGNLSTSYLDYKLLNGAGSLQSASPITQQIANNPLGVPVELKPGAQVEGRLIYEVNTAEQGWTLVHKETYHKSSDNTSFTVESDILLSVRDNTTSATTPPPAASTDSTSTQTTSGSN